MAKSFIDKHFGALVLIAIAGVALYVGSNMSWDFSKFNLGTLFSVIVNVQEGQSGGTNNATPQTIYIERTNICNAFQPTINELAAFYGVHPSTTCTAGGGEYLCDANHCGCYGFDAATVDCTNPIYLHILAQCSAYGAIGYCDPTNFYCEYR